MPRFNVQRPDGQWACFSTVVDGYITPFMPFEQYEEWRTDQYGRTKSPIEHSNIMEFSEAEEIIKGMKECGTDVCRETN